jgi:hypothetical protein
MLGIQLDLNGDRGAGMIIRVNGYYGGLNMTAADFIL